MIAIDGLHVESFQDGGPWRWWLLRAELGSPTWVLQGPDAIVVTGDLAAMVFERPGGLGLGFYANGLAYVAQKLQAGAARSFDPAIAEVEVEEELTERIEETDRVEELDGLVDRCLEVEDLDFEDEVAVSRWLYETTGSEEWRDLGSTPSLELQRALACIECVHKYETAASPPKAALETPCAA